MFREQHLGEEIVQGQIIGVPLDDLRKRKEIEARTQAVLTPLKYFEM